MNGLLAELVAGYASLFVQCWDYYAVQQGDGSYRPVYRPLTLEQVASHLRRRFTLGTYMVDRWGRCGAAVFDADRMGGLKQLARLSDELAEQGISTVLEASRREGHLWLFVEGQATARAVRAWLLPYALAYGVELYPKQDEVRPDGVGSLVRLPLGVHRRSGGWYPFVVSASDGRLVPVGETVADCCAWVCAQARRVEVPDMGRLGKGGQADRGRQGFDDGGRGEIRAWCQVQDIVEVIGRYTRLDRRGVGRCPLPGHHVRGDVRPSLQVFGGSDPHWYCYTWGRAGNVFDFLCLYHGLTVREAWDRLRKGVLF